MEESFSLSDVSSYCESEMNIPDESEIDPRVGVGFHPTHEEVIQILKHKSSHRDYEFPAVFDANIYDHEPDALQGLGAIRSDGKFYFFCQLKPVNGSGECFNRSTETGYWKVTGRKFTIKARSTHDEIGIKRTLVFYKRFPGGREEKTNWVMHEYSANNNSQDLVVCKIKEKKEKVREEDKKRKGRKGEEKLSISTRKENKRAKKNHISTNDDRNHSQSQILREQGSTSSCISNIENDVWISPLGSSSSSQGSNRNLSESPMPPEQGFSSSSQGSNLPDPGSSSSNVSSMENDGCNSPVGPSSSSAGSNGNHRQSLMLQEQGFSPSSQGSNLPEQGSSSYSVFSNENDVWNSLGSEWGFSPLFSPIEFLQQIVVFPDDSVANVNSHAVEDTSLVDSSPLENLNVLNGSIRQDQTSFSMQSPILPEQGASSSSVSINENEMLNSSYGSENQGEDYLQEEWLGVALDEYLNEETRHTRGFCGGDSSDVGTEIFNPWEDVAFWNNTLEHV